MKIDILGVGIDNLITEEAVQCGIELMDKPAFHYVVTPNPEFILAAQKDEVFCSVLNEADLALPDGIGVIYASKILGHPLRGRATGVDFAQGLMASMAAKGKRLFLLGAKPGVAERAAQNLTERYSGLCICGIHDGYFTDDTLVAEEIRASGADVVFVCLGAPKQELWIKRYGPTTGVSLAVGLGGCLDVFAGNVQRAPAVMQKYGLEWLYRLYKEPQRIGRMSKLPLILVKAVRARLGGK